MPVKGSVGVARRLTLSTGEALARRDPDRRRLRRLQRRVTRATRHSGSAGRRCRPSAAPGSGSVMPTGRRASRRACRRFTASPSRTSTGPDPFRNKEPSPRPRAQQTRPQPRHRRPGLVSVRHDPEGRRAPAFRSSRCRRTAPASSARNAATVPKTPGVLPAPVPALRARLRPRPQRGHQHPAAGLGSSVSRGHGRTGRAPRARTKRGGGPARHMDRVYVKSWI